MTLFTLGVSHKTAPIAIRERLAFSAQQLPLALKNLAASAGLSEVALLSTCNRTEVYGNMHDPEHVLTWWQHYCDLSPDDIRPYLYTYCHDAAVAHMMRVASGLDSMMVGEPQILGQMKAAYQVAGEAGVMGRYLDRLFQNSFSVAKRVRRETAIGAQPVSVAYSAVSLCKQIFADLAEIRVLLIGAGQTIELVAKHLWQQGVRSIVIANRSLQTASQLAAEYQGQGIGLEAIPHYLASADMVVTATGATQPLIVPEMMQTPLKVRKHRPVFMVDLAVPRNIHPDLAKFDDIYLYCVDDLQAMIDSNLQSRQSAAETAEKLVSLQSQAYMTWLQAEKGVETLKKFRTKMSTFKEEVHAQALRKLKAGQPSHEIIEQLVHTLSQKYLHLPSVKLRDSCHTDPALIDAIKAIYDIE